MFTEPTRWALAGLLTIGISVLLSACGKDKNSGSNGYYCDAYGCYDPYNYNPYTEFPNFPNGGYPKTAVISDGAIQVTDRNTWKSALDTMINCRQEGLFWDYSSCGMQSNGNMFIHTVVYDYLFTGTNKTSRGEVIIGGQYSMKTPYYVVWKLASDGKSYSTYLPKNFTSSYNIGDASQVRIIAYGKSNAEYVEAVIKYGTKVIGQGRIVRTNVPNQPINPGYPTQPRPTPY